MKLIDIPKFVINLEKRPERLQEITQEMKYMSWDFEIFKGIRLSYKTSLFKNILNKRCCNFFHRSNPI